MRFWEPSLYDSTLYYLPLLTRSGTRSSFFQLASTERTTSVAFSVIPTSVSYYPWKDPCKKVYPISPAVTTLYLTSTSSTTKKSSSDHYPSRISANTEHRWCAVARITTQFTATNMSAKNPIQPTISDSAKSYSTCT